MDASADFLERITSEPQPLLRSVSGSLRFDITDGPVTTHTHLTIDHGVVTASHDAAPADVVAQMDKRVFDDIRTGRVNAVAATLRGEIAIDGNPRLLNILQRLFPGPSRSSAS
jgi:putative sterol carrier protein